ncbi:hypothetical protein D9M68_509430 [compost metagenome]
MSELLFLRFLLCLFAAYAFALAQVPQSTNPPCWFNAHEPQCWPVPALTTGSVRHER